MGASNQVFQAKQGSENKKISKVRHSVPTTVYTFHGFNPCILPLVSLLIDLGDQCHMSQLSTSDNVTTDSTPLNRCFSSPCQNGGECLENSMTSFCDCKNGEIIFVNSVNYMSPDSRDILLITSTGSF